MVWNNVLRTDRRVENGEIIIRKIVPEAYKQVSSIDSGKFSASQFGMFGVEDKVLVLTADWDQKGRPTVADAEAIEELAELSSKRFRDIKGKAFRRANIIVSKDLRGAGCLEVTRGIFRSPSQEFELDRIIKEEMEAKASKQGLRLLYAGRCNLTATLSYGHHVHWSAGNPLNTFLSYIETRNEMWRVTALSANSPQFNLNRHSGVVLMNDRLGCTFVKYLVPNGIRVVSGATVGEILYWGLGSNYYPLLIDKDIGTLELRASDIDPRSSATVAYNVLLLRAIRERILRERNIAVYRKDVVKDNMKSAKKYAMSDEGYVVCLIDGELAEVPIRQEMIRHFEQVMLPTLRKMEDRYRKEGKEFMPKCVLDEIQRRIYDGTTPAQRQATVYRRVRAKSTRRDALIAAQRLNFFNQRNYFR